MIIGASVLVLGYYPPFTYLFAVTVQYKIGEVGHYGSTCYSWSINKFLHLKNIYIDTTSPLLNHTFESAGRYRYRLIVSNAVSTTYAEGGFTGHYVVMYFLYYRLTLILSLLSSLVKLVVNGSL